MKENDFLDAVSNIETDVVERFVSMDNELSGKAEKKKRNGIWLRYGAIAACCAFLLGGSLIAINLFNSINKPPDFDPSTDHVSGGIDETEKETDTNDKNDTSGGISKPTNPANNEDVEHEPADSDGGKDEPNADVTDNYSPVLPEEPEETETSPELDTAPGGETLPDAEDVTENPLETDVETEEVELAFIPYIDDDNYSGYEYDIFGSCCDPELVGEKIGEIKIGAHYGSDVLSAKAEVYEVIGIDKEFCLCIRYIDSEESSSFKEFCSFDDYYFIMAENYSFASLDDMRSSIMTDEKVTFSSYVGYYKNSTEDYPKDFVANESAFTLIHQYMTKVDAENVYADPGKFETVHAESNEFVLIYYTFDGPVGLISGKAYVYDTGYIFLSSFGGQLFGIDSSAAKEMIKAIIESCDAEGYFLDKNGIWRPEGYIDTDAEYSSFGEALVELKLLDQLNFFEQVSYWEDCFGGVSPEKINLSERYLLDIADMLYAADGPAVDMEFDEVLKLSDEALFFEFIWGEHQVSLAVYDSGYVWVFEQFYYIDSDADYTGKIFYTVHSKCTAEDNYYWNSSEKKWDIYNEDDPKFTETKATSPKESIDIDHGYGEDVYETDVETAVDIS